jgi:hypothetical protein
MAMKEFLVSSLDAALELGIGTAEDVLKHVTPDVLAQHLPRPLWARLITACLGAPTVNAHLVVETIGIPNLCEHVPHKIMWCIVSDVALRALGTARPAEMSRTEIAAAARARTTGPMPAAAPPSTATLSTSAPSPAPASPAPQPAASEAEAPRVRTTSRPPFRNSGTNAGAASRGALSTGGSGARRPQAATAPQDRTPVAIQVPAPQPASALVGSRVTPPSTRRGNASSDFDIDTDVRAENWKGKDVDVDEDQLIDWASSDETLTTDAGSGPAFGRKPSGG